MLSLRQLEKIVNREERWRARWKSYYWEWKEKEVLSLDSYSYELCMIICTCFCNGIPILSTILSMDEFLSTKVLLSVRDALLSNFFCLWDSPLLILKISRYSNLWVQPDPGKWCRNAHADEYAGELNHVFCSILYLLQFVLCRIEWIDDKTCADAGLAVWNNSEVEWMQWF